MSPCYSRQAPAAGRDRRACRNGQNARRHPTAPFATRARCCEEAHSMRTPGDIFNPRSCEPVPAPDGTGRRRQPPANQLGFKHAPQTRPYMSAAASPTLTRTPPPPAGLSTGARAWRPETKPVAISLPSSGNLGSLALSMASIIAQPRTLVKRASAIIALRCCPVRLSADQTP